MSNNNQSMVTVKCNCGASELFKAEFAPMNHDGTGAYMCKECLQLGKLGRSIRQNYFKRTGHVAKTRAEEKAELLEILNA